MRLHKCQQSWSLLSAIALLAVTAIHCRASDHWAFQPIVRPQIPAVNASLVVRNPIDAFVLSKQRDRGNTPAAEASNRVLIRRLSFDLLGLPPTAADVKAFLADDSPLAYEKLVDRLLASPQYGERWGRHWLDVARWSETEGYESNHPRPFAWRFRDYVVSSFNADKPFDLFLRQQIAGDEMQPYADENVIATGFLAACRLSSNEEDKWLQRNAVLVDVVNATGNAFLGLTIQCAQCHDHKFDPITMRDYYSLMGFFVQGQPVNVALKNPKLRQWYRKHKPPEYEPALAQERAIFEQARSQFIAEAKGSLTPAERQAVETPSDQRSVEQELLARRVINLKLQATPKQIKKFIPQDDRKRYDRMEKHLEKIEETIVEPQTWAFYSPVNSPHELTVLPSKGFYPLPYQPDELARAKPYIHIRGDVDGIGPAVTNAFPEVLDAVYTDSPRVEDGRREGLTRLDLADWLTDSRNPLTARVWVNRIWQDHFGRGLVPTPNDFGIRTPKPVHAELLDWLASELIAGGWSTKHIHRLIVTSHTYRQSSAVDSRNAKIDPDGEFLWHWVPRRLEAEALRDAMLTVTGELDWSMGGPSVPLEDADQSRRRSLYLFQKRGQPPELQGLFDGLSEAAESCPRRLTSTTPLQSLYLLNDEFTLNRARELAGQLVAAAGEDRSWQIDAAFERILGRRPDQDEQQAAYRFFDSYQMGNTDSAADENGVPSALVSFCQALLNLNEFVYLE